MQGNSYEEITLKTIDGTTVYWPKGDMSRLVPAAVCGLATQILELRSFIKNNKDKINKIDPTLLIKLEKIARPIPFESSFLSGKIEEVHNKIVEIGEKCFEL